MNRLEFERRSKRLTLAQVAESSGCSTSYLSLCERGHRRPSEAIAKRLAKTLGVPVSEWKSLQKPV
jgi:transcriptional regulator with XRE-family HTH domain